MDTHPSINASLVVARGLCSLLFGQGPLRPLNDISHDTFHPPATLHFETMTALWGPLIVHEAMRHKTDAMHMRFACCTLIPDSIPDTGQDRPLLVRQRGIS